VYNIIIVRYHHPHIFGRVLWYLSLILLCVSRRVNDVELIIFKYFTYTLRLITLVVRAPILYFILLIFVIGILPVSIKTYYDFPQIDTIFYIIYIKKAEKLYLYDDEN